MGRGIHGVLFPDLPLTYMVFCHKSSNIFRPHFIHQENGDETQLGKCYKVFGKSWLAWCYEIV